MFSDKIISYIYGSIKHVDVPSIELKRKEKYKNKKIEKKEKVNYIPNIEVKKLKRKEKYRNQETEKKEKGWLYSKYRSKKIEKKRRRLIIFQI